MGEKSYGLSSKVVFVVGIFTSLFEEDHSNTRAILLPFE